MIAFKILLNFGAIILLITSVIIIMTKVMMNNNKSISIDKGSDE